MLGVLQDAVGEALNQLADIAWDKRPERMHPHEIKIALRQGCAHAGQPENISVVHLARLVWGRPR